MAKDYRRTSSTRPSKRYTKPAPANSNSGFKWIIIGILVGVLIAIAIFWEYAPSLMHKSTSFQLGPAQTRHHHATAKKENSAANMPVGQSHAPQFDFYTLLPKSQVDSGNMPPAPPASTPKKTVAAAVQTAPATAPNSLAPADSPAVSVPPRTPKVAETAGPPASAPPVSAKSNTAPEDNANRAGKYVLQVASVKNYSDADRLKAQLSMLGLSVIVQKFPIDGQVWNRVFVGPFPSKQLAVEKQQTLRENNISSMVVKQ